MLPIVLVVLLFLPQFTYAQADAKVTDSRLSHLIEKIKALKEDVLQTTTSKTKTNAALKKTDIKVSNSANDLAITNKKLQQQMILLTNLQKKQAKLEHDLSEQRDVVSEQLRHVYRLEKQDPIKMLLNQDDVNDIDRTLVYYRYFNAARLEMINTMRTTLAALHENEQSIRAQTQVLQTLKARQVKQRQVLLTQHREQEKLLQTIKAQLHDKHQQLIKLDEDKKALTALLEKIKRQHKQQASNYFFVKHKGRLPAPTKGRITMRFNDALAGQSDLALHGIIISAPTGQAVNAVAPGKVVFADWLRGMGLLMIIDHGNGYMSLYGHNQTLQKATGDVVKQGETIALVGQSGGQTKPGLYFAIRHNGVALDPSRWYRA